jgi:hypothetical protein
VEDLTAVVRRALNAFLIAFAATGLALIEDRENISTCGYKTGPR